MIDESVTIAAPPSDVWRALVSPEGWWPHMRLSATSFEERWTDSAGTRKVTSGQVVGREEPKRLALTWADEDWPTHTEVEVTLTPVPGGTLVRVRHTGWASLLAEVVEAHSEGWRAHLTNLKAWVER
ncbi:SRPBCC family protein [Actinosynnema sp. CA-248983]